MFGAQEKPLSVGGAVSTGVGVSLPFRPIRTDIPAENPDGTLTERGLVDIYETTAVTGLLCVLPPSAAADALQRIQTTHPATDIRSMASDADYVDCTF